MLQVICNWAKLKYKVYKYFTLYSIQSYGYVILFSVYSFILFWVEEKGVEYTRKLESIYGNVLSMQFLSILWDTAKTKKQQNLTTTALNHNQKMYLVSGLGKQNWELS